MIAVLQRIGRARVTVQGREVGAVGEGLLVLLGVLDGDGPSDAERLAERTANYRVFPDGEGRMNRSIQETGGAVLVVSQFTLAADGRKGRRPSFDAAAAPALAEPLYRRFTEQLAGLGVPVATGVFGAAMEVELLNVGPATFLLVEGATLATLRAPPKGPGKGSDGPLPR